MSANSEGSEDDFKKLGPHFRRTKFLAGLLGSSPGCMTGMGFIQQKPYKTFLFWLLFVGRESLNPLFDNSEFQSSYVQRAFQYLKLCESDERSLDHFWFIPRQVMGDHAECIETLTR